MSGSPQEATTDGGAQEAQAGSVQFVGTFEDLGLPESVLTGLKELGYKKPTLVQSEVFGPVKEGNDVIVQSRTGSGKTTAFCLPVEAGIDPELKRVQAVALTPTRELANQVAKEASRIGHHHGIKVVAIYGGASMQAQIDALEAGAQFVVGTPGRVNDLIRRGHLKLGKVRYAVLDEADEMLSMGFWDEVTGILDRLPKERQTLLFSATLPHEIERAAAKYLNEPTRVDLSRDTLNVSTIRHCYHTADENVARPRNFLYLLEFHRPRNAIVFCNRRDETELIQRYLQRFGFRAEALNGDMSQGAREAVLRKVKAGELDLMVATDVAARGIDISDLDFVFNYDLPEFDEVYVHRSGRTGRIGKMGTAVSLVRGRYLAHLTALKRDFGVPFEELELPEEKEILWMQAERIAAQLVEDADGVELEQYRPVAEAMLERGDIKELLAFLLRTHYSAPAPKPTRDDEREDGGRSRRERRDRDDRDDRRARGGRDRDRDRGERSSREDRDDAGDQGDRPANLYVTLGKNDGIEDLHALIAHLAEISGVDAGHFTGTGDVRDHSSHIEVDNDVADKVVEGVNGKRRANADEIEAENAKKLAEMEAKAADEGEESDDGDDGRRSRKPRLPSPTIVCERAKSRSGGGRDGRRPRARSRSRGPRR